MEPGDIATNVVTLAAKVASGGVCPTWPQSIGIALGIALFTFWNMRQGARIKRVERSHRYFKVLFALLAFTFGAQAQVFFSPGQQCREAVVNTVMTARESVQVQAYVLTDPFIAQALTNAAHRHVAVTVVADLSMLPSSDKTLRFLKANGVSVFIDGKHRIAHNKVLIADGKKVLTGSFNYTRAATESNAENLVVLTNGVASFCTNFSAHLAHSNPL